MHSELKAETESNHGTRFYFALDLRSMIRIVPGQLSGPLPIRTS
jgi:hypothetical protein